MLTVKQIAIQSPSTSSEPRPLNGAHNQDFFYSKIRICTNSVIDYRHDGVKAHINNSNGILKMGPRLHKNGKKHVRAKSTSELSAKGDGQMVRYATSVERQHRHKKKQSLIDSTDKIQLWRPELSTTSGQQVRFFLNEEDQPKPAIETTPEPIDLKFSQKEYKRLSEQIRDVGAFKAKYRGKGFQQFYCNNQGENVPLIYRSQLSESLKVFRDRAWRPYIREEPDTGITRCRPVSCRSDYRRPPCMSPVVSSFHRNRSRSAVVTSHRAEYEESGEFDTLSPRVLYQLSNGAESYQSYGDRSQQADIDEQQESDIIDNGDETKFDENAPESGIETDQSDSEDTKVKVSPRITEQKKVPMLNLRPEKLDDLYIPEGRKDRRKFDFDAENVDIPVYEFKYPLTGGFEKMDWTDLVETMIEKEDDIGCAIKWQDMIKRRPNSHDEISFINRLIELERNDIETSDWEDKKERAVQVQKAKKRHETKLSNIPKYQSAKRDKNCCSGCLQPACAGDCPEKRVPTGCCPHCRQKFCNGVCQTRLYDTHSRDYKSENDVSEKVSIKTRPSSCSPCQSAHRAKIINANNVILGRPKSSNVTYVRGAASVKPRDLRPKSGICVTSVAREITKLGLSPTRPSTGKQSKRHQGRNALIPGKSFFSQRRNSLSEPSSRRAKSAGHVRTSSFKDFRSKTANTQTNVSTGFRPRTACY